MNCLSWLLISYFFCSLWGNKIRRSCKKPEIFNKFAAICSDFLSSTTSASGWAFSSCLGISGEGCDVVFDDLGHVEAVAVVGDGAVDVFEEQQEVFPERTTLRKSNTFCVASILIGTMQTFLEFESILAKFSKLLISHSTFYEMFEQVFQVFPEFNWTVLIIVCKNLVFGWLGNTFWAILGKMWALTCEHSAWALLMASSILMTSFSPRPIPSAESSSLTKAKHVDKRQSEGRGLGLLACKCCNKAWTIEGRSNFACFREFSSFSTYPNLKRKRRK